MALKSMGDESEVSAQSGRIRVVDPGVARPHREAAPAAGPAIMNGFAPLEERVRALRADGKLPETQTWTVVDAVWEKTGLPVTVHHRDLGASLVAFSVQGLAFEAYTSEFEIDGALSYVQTDKDLVESCGQAVRLAEDQKHLRNLGILAWQFGGAKVVEKIVNVGFQRSSRIELVTSTAVPEGAVELRDAEGNLISVVHGVAEIRAGFAD